MTPDVEKISSSVWDDVMKQVTDAKDRSLGDEPGDELIIESGDKVKVVFLGEPWAYDAVWHDEMCRWVPARLSPVPVEPALRVRVNSYDVSEGKLKWWEMDTHTFRDLYRVRNKYGIDKWIFEIEALDVSEDGACGSFSILPDTRLDSVDYFRIQKSDLFSWEGSEK